MALMRPVTDEPAAFAAVPWRVGRKVGRTIYALLGDELSDADVLIGVMDTPELAKEAVDAHNLQLKAWRLGWDFVPPS